MERIFYENTIINVDHISTVAYNDGCCTIQMSNGNLITINIGIKNDFMLGHINNIINRATEWYSHENDLGILNLDLIKRVSKDFIESCGNFVKEYTAKDKELIYVPVIEDELDMFRFRCVDESSHLEKRWIFSLPSKNIKSNGRIPEYREEIEVTGDSVQVVAWLRGKIGLLLNSRLD